jgi:hypothetical protein
MNDGSVQQDIFDQQEEKCEHGNPAKCLKVSRNVALLFLPFRKPNPR